jgi:DnaJ-class molecular chaperone
MAGDVNRNLADLLTVCRKCNGMGVVQHDDGAMVCDVCGGNGHFMISWVYAYKEVRVDNGRTIPTVSESD